MNEIEAKIFEILKDIKKNDYSFEDILSKNFIQDLGFDSIEILSFILRIEETFNISLDIDGIVEYIVDFNKIVELVQLLLDNN